MAAFTVADGTDWLETMVFGSPADRWRLDDYDLVAHLKSPADNAVLLEMTPENGRLAIVDPVARRLEVNVGWDEIFALRPGPFRFDILFENKVTGVRSRSDAHTLSITPAITLPET